VPAAASGTSSAAFGPDSLRTASVKSGAGAPLSDRVYDWDAVGNLKHVSDSAGGAGGTGQYDAEYGYDDLRRVTSATLALPQKTPLDLAYGYDPLGNLTLIDGSNAQGDLRLLDGARQAYGRTVSQTCAGAPNPLPHALTSRTLLTALPANLTINALCYDGAGRLIRSVDSVRNSINSYTYYARGKVRAIVDRNGESRYLYDGNGVLVSKFDPVGATHIVLSPSYRELFDPSLPATPASFEAMYATSGRPIARRVLASAGGGPLTTSATALNWYSTDQLGGTAFMTNAQGQEVANSRAFYRPFGGFVDRAQPPQGDAAGNRLFTGKELESTGFYDFGARLYDPLTGRFVQADDADFDDSPQALNRFSYVLNNPLRFIDPSGHQPSPYGPFANPYDRMPMPDPFQVQIVAHAKAALEAHAALGNTGPQSEIRLRELQTAYELALVGVIAPVIPGLLNTLRPEAQPLPVATPNPEQKVQEAPAQQKAGAPGTPRNAEFERNAAGLKSVAEQRTKRNAPPAGSVHDDATFGKLNINGKDYYSQNAHGEPLRPAGVNNVSPHHMEGGAFGMAIRANERAYFATLYTDRPMCGYCWSAVRGYMRQLGIRYLKVVEPGGVSYTIGVNPPPRR
jgi:RHS repeat-associated protein